MKNKPVAFIAKYVIDTVLQSSSHVKYCILGG